MCQKKADICTGNRDDQGRIILSVSENKLIKNLNHKNIFYKSEGLTGGIQGLVGKLGSISSPGSIPDLIIESFAGIHDFFGGDAVGGYNREGNLVSNQAKSLEVLQNAWSVAAIAPATPFALSTLLPKPVWDTLTFLVKK